MLILKHEDMINLMLSAILTYLVDIRFHFNFNFYQKTLPFKMAAPHKKKEKKAMGDMKLDRNNADKLTHEELKRRITQALYYDFGLETSEAASTYIANTDDTEQLLDDLECDKLDCELVDHIMTNAGITHEHTQKVYNCCISAVNGLWINENIKYISGVEFYDDIVEATKPPTAPNINTGTNSPYLNENDNDPTFTSSSSHGRNKSNASSKYLNSTGGDDNDDNKAPPMNADLKSARDWLVRQWDHQFNSIDQNLDLLKLFAIGKKQDMIYLPGVLHEVYSQWRVNYLIDRKKKGKDNKPNHLFSDFVRKSKAFKKLNEKYKQLITSGVMTYGKRFSPQPIIQPFFQIRDNLYQFVQYSYIMSDAIETLIKTGEVKLPLQIDFWIIPKKVDKVDQEDPGLLSLYPLFFILALKYVQHVR